MSHSVPWGIGGVIFDGALDAGTHERTHVFTLSDLFCGGSEVWTDLTSAQQCAARDAG